MTLWVWRGRVGVGGRGGAGGDQQCMPVGQLALLPAQLASAAACDARGNRDEGQHRASSAAGSSCVLFFISMTSI